MTLAIPNDPNEAPEGQELQVHGLKPAKASINQVQMGTIYVDSVLISHNNQATKIGDIAHINHC